MGGYELAALLFVHEVSEPLTGLVKKIDKQIEAAMPRDVNEKYGVFIVFCNEDARLNQQLKDLIARERLKHVVLCTTNAAGPPRYRLAPEAAMTVVIYEDGSHVSANIPLRKRSLNAGTTEEILQAITKVLPKK